MANLFLSRTKYADTLLNEIREILDGDPEIDGGATTLSGGDLAVRTPCAEAAADGGKNQNCV